MYDFAACFNASRKARYLILFQRIKGEDVLKFGFCVEKNPVCSFNIELDGPSKQRHKCFVYSKADSVLLGHTLSSTSCTSTGHEQAHGKMQAAITAIRTGSFVEHNTEKFRGNIAKKRQKRKPTSSDDAEGAAKKKRKTQQSWPPTLEFKDALQVDGHFQICLAATPLVAENVAEALSTACFNCLGPGVLAENATSMVALKAQATGARNETLVHEISRLLNLVFDELAGGPAGRNRDMVQDECLVDSATAFKALQKQVLLRLRKSVEKLDEEERALLGMLALLTNFEGESRRIPKSELLQWPTNICKVEETSQNLFDGIIKKTGDVLVQIDSGEDGERVSSLVSLEDIFLCGQPPSSKDDLDTWMGDDLLDTWMGDGLLKLKMPKWMFQSIRNFTRALPSSAP